MTPQYPGTPAPKKKNNALTCCLISGGIFLVLGIVGVIALIMGAGKLYEIGKEEQARKAAEIPGYAAFDAVNEALGKKGAPGAAGNNDLAKQIATSFFSEYQAAFNQKFPDASPAEVPMGGADFATYCQLTDAACVILTNAPSARDNMTESQADDSEILAWTTANKVIRNILGDTDREIVVGLRGFIFYHEIISGVLDPVGVDLGGIVDRDDSITSKDSLYAYFADPAATTTTQEEGATTPGMEEAATTPMSTGPVISE